jgi:four helix bundle protein
MSAIESYRDLVVWQKGVDLVEQIYRLSSRFPKDEQFRLTSQITRAAASVPLNIAEGYGRESTDDYARFLAIARGSLYETETLVIIAVRLGYVTSSETESLFGLMSEVSRMLTALRKRLRAK